MVGGIPREHDAFNGRNYQANDVLIENCNFTNNIAYNDSERFTFCKEYYKQIKEGTVVPDYATKRYTKRDDGTFYEDSNGNYYLKRNETFNATGDAGAIYVIGNDTLILNCIFDDNKAVRNGAAVYIFGERTSIENSEFYNHDAFNGTVFIKGNDAKIKDTTFINNNATNGAAIYIEGNNANITNSILNNNTAANGTIYVKGSNTVVNESTLKFNNATNGAGIFINGIGSTISKSNFTNNTVTYHGGAVYIDGSNTKFENNNFINNTAIANDTFSKLSGLGGAIYVKGQNTISVSNNFEHNTARNGSAYYADGSISIKNDTFKENQAWSYLLITVAEPEESYYNTNDVRIKVVHVGGDNVLNAIHCNAPAKQIWLNNVTYIHSNPEIGKVTTPNEDLNPVEGVENSNKGQLVYKDDREWYQVLRINVTWVSANVPNRAILGANSNRGTNRGPNREETGIISENPFKYYSGDIHTNLYGDVYITLPKDKLKVGEYLVEAEHPEDWNYKQIINTTKFRILPQVDLSVVKTCSNITFFDDDIAVWTITVSNAANATNATNVVVTDILPSEFVFINYTATNNTVYDNKTGEWKIPKMANGTSETLIINSYAKSYIDRMNHFVNVASREDQIDITFERTSDKDTYLMDDAAKWTVTVTNNGDVGATDVNLTNLLPFEFEFVNATGDGSYDEDNNTWVVGNLPAHNTVTLTINSRAVTDVNSITNYMYLDYKEKHIKFNATKTGDKDQYQVGEDAVCTVTVKNIGSCPATFVVLRDILQPEFAYSSQYASEDSYDSNENMWVIDSLDVDEEATLTINCKAQRVSGNVTNYAVITGDQHDWDETNNIASANATVIPLPHPVKNVNNITPYYNDIIEYNLTIVNTGNVTYRNNLTVIDELPDELKYNGTYKIRNATVTRFVDGGQKLNWTITNITGNATITVYVKVVGLGEKLIYNSTFIDKNLTLNTTEVKYVGNLTNNLTVIGPNGTNKTTNRTVYPVPRTDISVNITSDKDEYFVDDIAVWTITVSNAANGTNATNVTLKDLFPSDKFRFVNCTLANGTPFTGDTWYIGDLANGTKVTFTVYSVAIKAGTANHNVTVSCNETEWNMSNNKANKSVVVVELPNPVKTVNNITPYYHDYVEFNLTVVNGGKDNYSNVLTVVDVLPDGLEFNGTVKVVNASIVNQTVGGKSLECVVEGQKITWKLTNITPGNATIVIRVKVNALGDLVYNSTFIGQNLTLDTAVVRYVGNLTNNLTVTGPNGTVKSTNKTIYPVPIVDLSINKTSDKVEYLVGDVVVWNITVHNAANGTNATNVTVTDVLPYNFEFVDCDPVGAYDIAKNVWYVGFMGNGTSRTLKIRATAKFVGSNVTNVANVTSNETDWFKDNNTANRTVDVLPYPVKNVNNITPYYNGVIEYTLTVVNNGNEVYANVLNVTDSLPDGLIFIGDPTISGANFVGDAVVDGQKITWRLTNILPGGATIVVRVQVVGLGNTTYDSDFIEGLGLNTSVVKYVGNLTNNLTVTGPNGTNKTVSKTIYPVPIVDLSVNKTSDKVEYLVGDVVVWTITVYNAGNGTNATNVTVTDVLPYNFEFIDCTPDGAYDSDKNIWYIGFMGNGTSRTLKIRATAKFVGSNVTNVANVTSNETDWFKDNNTANRTVDVLPYPVKNVNNYTPYYNSIIEYNLTIVNNGEANYTNVLTVVDSLPVGLLFNGTVKIVGAKLVGVEVVDGQKITWKLTNISTANATIVVKVKVVGLGNTTYDSDFIDSLGLNTSVVKYVGNLTNNLTVTGPNGTNKTVSKTIYPVPIVDLSVNKTADRTVYFADDIAIWTIVVYNAGNGTNATNVTLKDVFPEDKFEFINCTLDNGTEFKVTDNVWYIGFMGNGTSRTLTIYSRAKDLVNVVNATNTVTVTSNETDWFKDNNTDSATVEVSPLPNPVKTVNNITPYYGDVIEYNLTVVNRGNGTYINNLNVTDSLPVGLIFVEVVKVTGADVVKIDDDNVVTQMVDGKSINYIVKNITDSEGIRQEIKWILTNITEGNATIAVKVKVLGLGDLIYNSTFIGQNLTLDTSVVKYVGNLTNNLTVTGPNGTNKTTSKTIYPVPLVDISVNITSDKDEYFIDDIAVWTIVVSNDKDAEKATNVTLKDVFPSDNFKFINCTDQYGNEYKLDEIWYIGDLANGTNITFTVYSQAIKTGTNIPHNASVSCNETEWNYTNNNATKLVDVIVLPQPVKEASNHTPHYHDVIEYNLTVVNTGKYNYTYNLTVIDSLPDGLEFIGVVNVTGAEVVKQTTADGSLVDYIVDGQNITWILTNISTKNAIITVQVRVNDLGNLTNNLTIIDYKGTNATVNETVKPKPYVDISVNITSDKDEYFVDDIAVWTITVSNAGNGTNATSINLKDLFPSDYFDFINCTDENGNPYDLGDDWVIPFMGNGTNLTFVVYSLAVNPGEYINNTAKVSCSEDEWNYTNNNATKLVNVVVLPQPVKNVTDIAPHYHDIIEYNLTVVNSGNNNYMDNLTVIDSLPVGLEFIDVVNVTGAEVVRVIGDDVVTQTIDGKYIDYVVDGQKITWILTNITKGGATITVRVYVNDLGNLTNNLTIIGPRGTNATVNCTVRPVPKVDISVNITSDKDEYFVDDIAVWTITVSNAGNGTNATNINLKDLFPSDYFDFINCTDENGNPYDLGDDWVIPFMGNGTNLTFVVYSLAVNPGEYINNTAKVSCSEDEWNYTNNNATKLVNVVVLPQPVKDVSNVTPHYRDIIEYNLTVVNSGSNNYMDNLAVIDSLPVGLEFIDVVNVTGAEVVIVAADNVVIQTIDGKTIAYVVDGQNITWILTNITQGSATITVRVYVNNLGNLTNNLTIIGPKGTNATVNCTVNPVPLVDVSVDITSDKDEYFVDDIAVWTITVSNAVNGTNATNINLKDLFPSDYFKFINCTDENGNPYDLGDDWVIPFMGNGTNLTFVVYSVAVNPGEYINNTAKVSCSEDEWNYANNNATKLVNVVVLPQPVKEVSDSAPHYHDVIEYNLTVVNSGSDNYMDNLTVIDSLPFGLEFIETVDVIGAIKLDEIQNGQVVTWILTNITRGSATITVRVYVNDLGNLTNNLTIIGPRGTNATVNCTVNPVPLVDVSVDITSDKDEYFVDDIAVWTITVSNAGNGTNATNINLKDLFPSDYFEFINCTDENGNPYDLGDDWVIPFMGNGTNMTFVITSVAVNPGENIDNTAKVNCSEDEWNYTNNNATKLVNVVPLPEPIKVASNITPYYHDVIEYYLIIYNTGANNYTDNLTVIDSLPEGLVFNGTVGISRGIIYSESVAGNVITWIVSGIPANNVAIITIKVQVNDLGNLTNNLTIIGPRGTNATVNETVVPMPKVDVSVDITSDKDVYFKDDIAVWTITVSNAVNGTNATSINLKDLFPSDYFKFINCTDENGNPYDLGDDWVIPFMGNGTSMTFIINSVALNPGENIDNTAKVNCSEDEWDYTNNNATKLVNVVDLPYPVKSVDNITPNFNGIVEYNLTIVNAENTAYTSNLTVIDSLPSDLEFIETVNVVGADGVSEVQDGQKITWIITNIVDNATVTVRAKVVGISDKINDTDFIAGLGLNSTVKYVGSLTNNLTIMGPNGTEKTVNCTIYPIPVVDISVNITSDKKQYNIDDVAVWTITVHNNINSITATEVALANLIPNNFEFIGYATENGTFYPYVNVWSIGDLGNGETVNLILFTRAKTTGVNVTGTASVVCAETEWNLTNNVDEETVDIISLPVIEKTVNNVTPYNHDVVEYNLTITNTGNTPYADTLNVIDSLPAGLVFNGTVNVAGADLIAEVADGQTITWTIANISAKSSAVITIRVFVNDIGSLTNNLTLVGPNGTNMTVNCTINPVPIADLEVEKHNSLGLIRLDDNSIEVVIDEQHVILHKGDTVKWYVTVKNNGPDTAVNTVATDKLPAGLRHVSDDSHGNYNHETGTWNVGNLASGESVTLTIVTVVESSNITITNPVDVTSDTYDPDKSNNYDNSSVFVQPEADLEIVKLVSDDAPHQNDKITWTIIVKNNGADTAINTVATDKLPEGLIYYSDDSKGAYNHETGIGI